MPLTSWPTHILDEFQTVAKLQEGCSVSRFGDGECALCDHSDYVREAKNATLTTELQQIISTPHERLIVGIPTLDARRPEICQLGTPGATVSEVPRTEHGLWQRVHFQAG